MGQWRFSPPIFWSFSNMSCLSCLAPTILMRSKFDPSSTQQQARSLSCTSIRDCTGRPFLGFLGFGLFGKITRVLGRVFGLLLVREKERICEKAYIFISHFKAYDCYTSKSYFFFIFDRKWDLSKNKSSVDWSLSRVRSLVMNRPTAEKALWSIQVSDKIWDHREIVLNHHDLF